MTEGRRALLKALSVTTERELAAKLRRYDARSLPESSARQRLSELKRGITSEPALRLAVALEVVLGIGVTTWLNERESPLCTDFVHEKIAG